MFGTMFLFLFLFLFRVGHDVDGSVTSWKVAAAIMCCASAVYDEVLRRRCVYV
jgi:hypothetical protein